MPQSLKSAHLGATAMSNLQTTTGEWTPLTAARESPRSTAKKQSVNYKQTRKLSEFKKKKGGGGQVELEASKGERRPFTPFSCALLRLTQCLRRLTQKGKDSLRKIQRFYELLFGTPLWILAGVTAEGKKEVGTPGREPSLSKGTESGKRPF